MAAARLKAALREADGAGTGLVELCGLKDLLCEVLPCFSEAELAKILGHLGEKVPYEAFVDSLFSPRPLPGRLAGKVAIVTGAGSSGPGWGIGKAISVAFARQGAAVGLVDVNEEAAGETAKVIRGEGGACLVLPRCDISKVEEVDAMLATCERELGPVTSLVNNVGIVCPGDVTSVPLDKWDAINGVNLVGAYNCTRGCVLSFLKGGRKGSVVNVSSISSLRALRSEVAYAASKAAVNALTMAVGRELAGRGVRCNCIAPGLMDTPLVANMLRDKSPQEFQEAMAARHSMSPTGQMGDAWDIAHACVYFCSDESSYANGVTMAIDGGFTQQVLPHPSGMPLMLPKTGPHSMDETQRLAGKTALVTGANFCGAVARLFVRHGAKVFLACNDSAALAADLGAACTPLHCDLASPESVEAALQKLAQASGGLDLLVNGPGLECAKGIEELGSEEFRAVYRRNATGPLLAMRFAIPQMLQRGGGAIVNVTSMAALRYSGPEPAVAAAAGSVNAMTVQTAAEFGDRGLRCNGLVPFLLREDIEALADDVARAALFLCSDEARCFNGQLLQLDMAQASRVVVRSDPLPPAKRPRAA